MVGLSIHDRLCYDILQFARTTPATPLGAASKELYTTDRAQALRYDFDPVDIMQSRAANEIATDGSLAAIAGEYFGCRPTLDFVAMWWTTSRGPRDLSSA